MANTRNLTHGSLLLQDAQTLKNTFAIAIDEGNLTWTEELAAVVVKHRGVLDHLSRGEEMALKGSFTIKFDAYTNQSTALIVAAAAGGATIGYTLRDFARDAATELTSSNGRTDVFTFDMIFTIADPVLTGDENEVLTFPDTHADSFVFSEGAEYNSIACNFVSLANTPTAVRA